MSCVVEDEVGRQIGGGDMENVEAGRETGVLEPDRQTNRKARRNPELKDKHISHKKSIKK